MTQYASYPSLKNRVILITGGGSGIGAALVSQFVLQGAKVAFVDIDDHNATKLRDKLSNPGNSSDILYRHCDIKDTQALQTCIQQTSETLGPIHTLINNAASDDRHEIDEVTEQSWNQNIAINLRPHFFAAQAAYKDMQSQKQGSIINVSSNCCLRGLTGYPIYVAAKAAILGLSKSLAREFGPYGIRVNSIVPGWVMTDKQMSLWLSTEAEQELMQQQCIKEKIFPDEVARLALFLAADDSRFITNQHHIIDGGIV